MTINEATMLAVHSDETPKMLEEWNKDPRNRVVLAEFLADTLKDNGGKLTLKDVAFVFILGMHAGQIMTADAFMDLKAEASK